MLLASSSYQNMMKKRMGELAATASLANINMTKMRLGREQWRRREERFLLPKPPSTCFHYYFFPFLEVGASKQLSQEKERGDGSKSKRRKKEGRGGGVDEDAGRGVSTLPPPSLHT